MKQSVIALMLLSLIAFTSAAVEAQSSYTITDAKFAPVQYDYLSVKEIEKHLKPNDVKLFPDLSSSKVIVLAITFNGDGKSDLYGVDLDDLEVRWNEKAITGRAPAVGAHFSKDFILIRQKGIYISMKNNSSEFFFIVPASVSRVSLGKRQPDGAFTVVKPDVLLKADPGKARPKS